ncbi:ATPase PAAT-like isoform X2 [Ursus americanus]|uniref:ATPase PAAT-like isoform X2 n=1 Tax=Ursus americanus TaxID=9643 RepID=UPI001E67D39A|nr:ATPase PAAT-like isoform X2 [Ursus americanus]
METGAEDAGLSCRPMLASSWDAACGALTHSLHLTRADLGARDLDWEEPLAPPAPGQDLVVLKSSLSSPGEKPCFLYLRCDPNGGEEIVSVGILSSARNMEVYLGEEYCGTSRGKTVCGDPENSENEKIILYKKHLKLEPSTHACKIKNCVPTGEQLQSVWGNTGHKRMVDLQSSSASGAPDKSPSTPFPFRTGLTSGNGTEDLKASIDKSPQPPGGGNITNLKEYNIVPQNHSLLENDLRNAVSSLLPKKASDSSSIPKSELLPFLQNLCSQVNHLRVGHDAKWQEGITKAGEGVVAVAMEEQPVCACLEKILTKNMELMEKKLVDYIDQRLSKLQEHMDARMALLADLLRSPSSPPPGPALRQWDSRERLSNGER